MNLARLIRAGGLSPSTFFRYAQHRDLGEPLWSPPGRPPVNIPDLDVIRELIQNQWDGQRHRLRGAAKIRQQYPEIPADVLRQLIAEVKAELLVIVTDEKNRSKGLGTELVNKLNTEFLNSRINNYIVTVHAEMDRSNAFYIKNQMKLEKTFSLYGTKWNMYKKVI